MPSRSPSNKPPANRKRRPEELASSPVPRRALRALLLSALLGLLLLAAALGSYYHWATQATTLDADQSQRLVIAPSSSWPTVVDKLDAAGLLRSRLAFEIWARGRGLPSAVKAGSFELRGPMTLHQLEEKLRQGGDADTAMLVFREGETVFHLADTLHDQGLADREEFLEACRDPELLAELGLRGLESCEGYLFPDSYEIKRGSQPAAIIKKMHQRFVAIWDELAHDLASGLRERLQSHQLDRHGVLTLASIVEREAMRAEERPIIARVFLNRLEKSMRLQSDPTCIYDAENYRAIPTRALCRDRLNRYSTYVIGGLPPGPIGAPGQDSLRAVLQPDSSARARKLIYFVARGDGSHEFSATLKEHNRAVDRYIRGK